MERALLSAAPPSHPAAWLGDTHALSHSHSLAQTQPTRSIPSTTMLGRPGRRGGAPLMAAPLSSDDYPDAHTGFRIALLEEGDALARAAGSATSGADEPRASRAPSEPPIEIQPLAGDDADRLVSRMAPIAAQDADEVDFAVRDKTLPAPRAGAVGTPPDACHAARRGAAAAAVALPRRRGPILTRVPRVALRMSRRAAQ